MKPAPFPAPDPQVPAAVRAIWGRPGEQPLAVAVRDRLGRPLTGRAFDHTVLPEFRTKVAEARLERVVLDALLERLKENGLIKAGGKQRTDSTHVAAAPAIDQREIKQRQADGPVA